MISKVQEKNEELRREMIKGGFEADLSPEERMVARETVLGTEKSEVIPAHLECEAPASVWLVARLN